MKITDAIHEFILYKQSLGMTYKNRALKLTAFARLAGPVEIDDISPETVRRFLDAGRPVTAEWFNKFSALKMFFRFALSRGYATRNPLPLWSWPMHLRFTRPRAGEFDKVFVVLPNPCRILSRELLYTALTRQTSKLILFCQGEAHKLIDYRHLSDAARRLTNLFEAPEPVQIGPHIYDDKHIHRSRRNELMISKSEVIIANELTSAGVVYEYERPFVGKDNTRRYPDFTIEDADTSITWFWEHLGMLGDAEYDRKWEAKLKWYRSNGVLPDSEGGGPSGTLLTSTEINGIDHNQIAAYIKKIKGGD